MEAWLSNYSVINNGRSSFYHNQHRYLVLMPLLIILLFWFGFVSATGHNRNIASRTKSPVYKKQSSISKPDGLPSLAGQNAAVPEGKSAPPANAENNTAAAGAPATGANLQPAVSGNSSPAQAVTGQPLISNPVKTVTDKLSF